MYSTQPYFEIFDGGDLIRIESLSYENQRADNDWDKSWLRGNIIIKGGAFSGQFAANFMTMDFEHLKTELKSLEHNPSGAARFQLTEGQLILDIKGNGLGHFEVRCVACDNAEFGATLTFSLSFDQMELVRLINAADEITKAFPVRGNFN